MPSGYMKCSECGKIVSVFDIGENGAYYDKNKKIVCFQCFKLFFKPNLENKKEVNIKG